MAQPIPLEAPVRDAREQLRKQLERAPGEHAEAILEAYETLQALHDHGALDLLRGMVGARDRLTDTLAVAVDAPPVVRAIRNFILLTKFFANLNSDVLGSLTQTAIAGAEKQKAVRAPGLLQLLNRLRSENSRHALSVMLDLLEAAGKGL
ncbi:MAG TPA: hypothetical protein VMB47_05880 [Candidatus Aquilonibacter sp.]|nr:hypothetical protein [Candidatus Aquilonibacter sp.]